MAEEAEKRKYPLNKIYFYLTKGCNQRCRHCWIAPQYQTEAQTYPSLDVKLFCSIIEQAKPLGLAGIKLTGGEPLLHPQIERIIEIVQKEEVSFTLETNGVLLTEKMAKKIAGCKSFFISVSLDGTDAETHEWVRGVKGCFEDTLKGIQNLVAAGLRPQLIMTLMPRNRGQMEQMVRLAERLGASSVKFNILQPTARGERMHDRGETLTIEELVEIGRWVETNLSASTSLPIYYDQPAAFRSLGKIFGQNGDGCSVCGILGILGVLADGSYALCGIGETVPELVFGHAAQDRLEDIWDNNPVLLEIREGLPDRLEGICGDCFMKSLCLGDCLAQNFYSSKNLWAPFWFCEEARKKGIFPESRIPPKSQSNISKNEK
jgi:SynChlorMet cassette radical SAM/SPASM protein ScmF